MDVSTELHPVNRINKLECSRVESHRVDGLLVLSRQCESTHHNWVELLGWVYIIVYACSLRQYVCDALILRYYGEIELAIDDSIQLIVF